MPQSLTVDKGVFQDLDTCHISPLQTVVWVFYWRTQEVLLSQRALILMEGIVL